jgi:hypothetical protein
LTAGSCSPFLEEEADVKSSRPDIPKKLAARVRGAQARVQELRDTLVNYHKRRLQAQAELDLFHLRTAMQKWSTEVA